ncbi:helix-turn-helix transcriptional regulator [Nonomuraea sp. CA-143628]|uniref:helix-turn-helix transcriptional regulator n=1 Tax=Nonomuraea sp. CA-143628 TaxID=3239997 RepID=UPI003D89E4ED
MSHRAESIGRTLPPAAAQAGNAAELGAVISSLIATLVPHDGYMLVGFDPVTGVVCFRAAEHGYSVAAARRLSADDTLDPDPFDGLAKRPNPVVVLSADLPAYRRSARVHELMAADGFGGELRIALATGGTVWGSLSLLRELTSRPFSAIDGVHAASLAPSLAQALQGFVAANAVRWAGPPWPPGVVLVGHDDTITATTPSGHSWLRELACHSSPVTDYELTCGVAWHAISVSRQSARPALSRIPTSRGWVALHAQPVDSLLGCDVALTIEPATATVLLPAVAAWHGLTPREQDVVRCALNGLPTKQIARRLEVSPYTVNDHLTAIYRKIGVTARDELLARFLG